MEIALFMPIIIMFLLISIIIFLISKTSRSYKRGPSSKKRPLFFMVYLGILTIGLIVTVLLPNNRLEKLEEHEGDYDGEDVFYAVMDQTKPIEEIAAFKQAEETYPLSGDQLDFSERSIYGDDYFYQDVSILIVKDPTVKDEFTVETYITPFIYNGNDISAFVNSTEVGGNDGVVHIHAPSKETVLSMYDSSFPFKQFTGEPSAYSGFGSYQIPSEQLFIIYIPEDVTPNVAHITGDSIYHVEMITKE